MEKSKANKWFKPDFDLQDSIRNDHFSRLPVQHKLRKKQIKKEVESVLPTYPHLNLIEQIHPNVISELAVHAKKVAEVENWLRENVKQSRKVSVLLLTGPTGAGKTAALKVLCKSLNIYIEEWINPVDQEYDENMYNPGQVTTFFDFLLQASRYPSLLHGSGAKKIVLVEDFPNAVIREPTEFEKILELLLNKGRSPLIFICTETTDSNTNLALKLFPQMLRDKFKISTISFNPVSVTLLKAALKRASVIIQEKFSSIYQVPSQETIDSIINSAMGDIRSAINYYNFACLKDSANLPNKVEISLGTKRKRNEKDKGTLSSMNRDESIGLLHGVGRVLYPKRIQLGSSWKFQHLPASIIDQFSTMPVLFVSFLRENYLRYFANFSNVRDAAEILSFAELFTSKWIEKEVMLEYGLWITVLGLMVFNENVISKWNPVQGPKYVIQKQNTLDYRKLNPIDVSYHNIINQTGTISRFSSN